MAIYPADAHRRNLEKSGTEVQAGPWRLTPLVDLVSEKRYLLYQLKTRSIADILPGVMTFRVEAAAAFAPGLCPEVLSLSIDGDRLEMITDYYRPLVARGLSARQLGAAFQAVLDALSVFQTYRMTAGSLFPEAIATADSGRACLLPSAYVLPYFAAEGMTSSGADMRSSVNSPSKLSALDPYAELDAESIHVGLVAKLIRRLVTDARPRREAAARSGFEQRLEEAADAITNGELRTLSDIHVRVFGKPPVARSLPRAAPHVHAAHSTDVDRCVEAITSNAASDGVVLIVRGPSPSSTTGVLQQVKRALERFGSFFVASLDEWDLFAALRKGPTVKGKSSTNPVWVIDDVDDKALVYSDFSTAMLASDRYPRGSVIMGVPSHGTGRDVEGFLDALRGARKDRFLEVDVAFDDAGDESGDLSDYLKTAAARIDPDAHPDAAAPADALAWFLGRLGTEERQLMELLSVARFAMPLDLVLSVFPDSSRAISGAIHHLLSLDAIELPYRRVSKKEAVALFVRVSDTSLRKAIYESIPVERRKRLHRTVALVAEHYGAFPDYFLLIHSLEAGETSLAADRASEYLRSTKDQDRHPYLVSMCVGLTQKGFLDHLPFADRILAYHELAAELLKGGHSDDAEKLLVQARDLIETGEGDQVLKNAPLLSAIYRMLADRFEARGEFKRALDLLEDANDDLQSALPLPDQAQLLNDIGWLRYRLGDYDKSMEACRLSLNTLNANQYPRIVAQALNLMGVVHFNTSRYDEAISYYEQSAYLRERGGDENALAASFNNLALAYQSKGEYEKALDYYNRSLQLKKHQNNKAGIAAGYLNLALLYLDGRNFKEAEARCRESLAISEELQNAQLVADNYTTLGDIALEGGNFEAAEKHYRESVRISHQREAINEEMGALRRLSTLCLKQGRYEEAKRHADEAYRLVQRIGSKYENAEIQVILGDLELKQGRQVEALRRYEKAAGHYTALSKYRLAATVFSKIGLIHAESGNTFEARHYHDRAQEFVRADIGRELPEEFVQLQHVLRAHPSRTHIVGKESQKLLMAFYELSVLTDYAMDRYEFIKKIMDVTRQIVDPAESFLAFKTGGGDFLIFDGSGQPNPGPAKADLSPVFRRTLLLGSLIDSSSQDVSDLLRQIKLASGTAFVCIPLKAMSEDLGCLLFYLTEDRLPLSKEDVNFFTWLGRQISGSLKLMLHLNEDFLKDTATRPMDARAAEHHTKHQFENLIGKSESMKRIFRTLEKVKNTDSGILILGESGTGKSALARAIHFNSPRRNRPFQEIHCAQIPHSLLESELFGHERGSFTGAVQRKLGLCEMAAGGTLFLDDINVMPVETQTKLLHFLESKSFMRLGGTQRLTSDVRIIAASNEDLETLCREGRFREDLYYRLKVILIDLPPLRERKDDMLAIALDYIRRSCTEKGTPVKTLAPETIQIFQKAPWRGNVRELQNVLERIVVLSDETLITPASLPDDFLKEVMGTSKQTHHRLDELIDEIVKLGNYSESNPLLPLLEVLLARRMVEHADGKARAAALLGISKPTLYARLKNYDKMH